jgi:outer membrane protein assembly factor BamD (BamD/ComL family)
MRSLKALTNLAVLAFVLLSSAAVAAQSKDDLYARGQAAYAKGDAIAARDAFCAIKDANFKDAAKQCADTTEAAKPVERLHNSRYLEGVQLLQDGKLDEAEAKFKSVKFGSRVADVPTQLQVIAKRRQDKAAADAQASQSAAAEGASKQRFDAGVDAYNRGDFTGAKVQLDGVSGRYQGEAQSYVNKINTYNAKMSEARGYEAAKNFDAARSAYTEAARIAPMGPGDPLGGVTRVTQLAAAASGGGAAPTPAKPIVKASKDEVKTIDVAKYLAEGRKQLARGDLKRARNYFGDVLAQEPNNADAAALMKEIRDKDTSGPANAADADPLLAAAIRKFYEGDYEQADYRLKNYIFQGQGKKLGLASFYAGATALSKFYLGGGTDQSLMLDARKKFKEAKGVEGFVVPEKMVSPKILKAFQEAS